MTSWSRSRPNWSGTTALCLALVSRFVGLYDKAGCREKLSWLLGRLTQLLAEDGRRPFNLKVMGGGGWELNYAVLRSHHF